MYVFQFQVQIRLASDLAAWNAKCKVLKDVGSVDKPKGKSGNCITRMYARTGWWPLRRESELWNKAIAQFGSTTRQQQHNVSHVDGLTQELGPDVKIRQVVLDAFRGTFLDKAESMKQEYDSKSNRRKSRLPCTVFGMGFCKGEDLTVVRANDKRLEERAEAKVISGCGCVSYEYVVS